MAAEHLIKAFQITSGALKCVSPRLVTKLHLEHTGSFYHPLWVIRLPHTAIQTQVGVAVHKQHTAQPQAPAVIHAFMHQRACALTAAEKQQLAPCPLNLFPPPRNRLTAQPFERAASASMSPSKAQRMEAPPSTTRTLPLPGLVTAWGFGGMAAWLCVAQSE